MFGLSFVVKYMGPFLVLQSFQMRRESWFLYFSCLLDVMWLLVRVGSHVVSVRIQSTEKWRTSFHTDVLSKSK